jgi:antitoxin ParD1/3/4
MRNGNVSLVGSRRAGETGKPLGFVEGRRRTRERLPWWQTLPNARKLERPTQREFEMPTRNISLTPEQHAFVEKVVEAGEYQNASETVREALRLLQQRHREDALKLKALRAAIKAGIDELDRGDFVELDAAELPAYVRRLGTTRASRGR